jgi:hypothetical protein
VEPKERSVVEKTNFSSRNPTVEAEGDVLGSMLSQVSDSV